MQNTKNKNSKTKLRKGDSVIVLTGTDKGKKGKIDKVLRDAGKVVIAGINEHNKHKRPKKVGEKGQLIKIAMPINASNVALFCTTCKKGVRIGALIEGNKKSRVCVTCKGSI